LLPRPRNESDASAITANAKFSDASTITGASPVQRDRLLNFVAGCLELTREQQVRAQILAANRQQQAIATSFRRGDSEPESDQGWLEQTLVHHSQCAR
jgi:hypothetical protein